MCVATVPVGATAAAVSAATATNIGLAISAISSVAGIAQAAQSASFQQQQADLSLKQQRNQAEVANQQAANQVVGDAAQRQKQSEYYNRQILNNQTSATKAQLQEQTKLDEARTKAAFQAQNIYAKSIGTKGTVLASGATGQSIGLLALDADRQAGLGIAEQNATVRSAARQAEVGSQAAQDAMTSANNQAFSQLSIPTAGPVMQRSPGGGPLEAPSYDWF